MRTPLSLHGWMRYDIVAQHLERIRPGSVLELGVGLAGISSRLAEATDLYVGVEPDPTSREIAAQRLAGRQVLADTAELEPSEKYDLVCAFEVIEHIEEDREALSSWAKFVSDGGHLLLSMPADSRRYGPWDRAAGHFRRYDPDDVRAVAEAAGLRVVDLRHYGYPVGNLLEGVRHRIASRSARVDRPMDEVTADSARQLQPPVWLGRLTELTGRPLARLQRPFQTKGRGTGIVALLHKPR